MNQQNQHWASQLLNNKTPGELKRLFSRITPFYLLSAFGAFLASFMFVAGVWLGGSWEVSQWTAVQWVSVLIALFMVGGITAGQYFAYGSGIKSSMMVTFKVIVIIFAVGSEVFQTMEREAETVRHRSENSAVFKGAVAAINNATAPTALPYAAEITAATVKLAQCEQRVKQGKEKHCDGNRAALDSYRNLSAQSQQASEGKTLAMVDKAKELQFDEKQHFQGIQFLQQALGISATAAAFVFAFGIIGTFEAMFYLLGVLRAAVGSALKAYGLTSDGKPLADEYTALGLVVATPAATPAPIAPAVTPANPANPTPASASAPPAVASSTYRANLEAAGVPVPAADTVMDKPSFGFIPQFPRAQAAGATGLHNPALGRLEQHYDLPLNPAAPTCTVHALHGGVDAPCTVHGEEAVREFTDDLYQQLRHKIQAGELEPTYRPVKEVLKSWRVGTSDRHRQDVARQALDRMHGEGVLKPNPANDGRGIQKAKYVLA